MRMRTVLSGLGLALSLFATESRAQQPTPWTTPGWPTYSYYAAPPGQPPRVYVSPGNLNDFPYHGQPYGHAYDRFSWGTLRGPDPRLNRYFYPPVP